MTKTATVTARVDEELKARAQEVLDGMGLPMSLAVEMFLRQVAERGRLPFAVGPEGPTPEELAEREARQRDFWRAFMVWYFQCWPRFDSPEAERRAREELGWEGRSAGAAAHDYISGGDVRGMTPEQWAAYLDVSAAQRLLLDAKELVYWALGMDVAFVPAVAGANNPSADEWRLEFLEERLRGRDWDEEEEEGEDGLWVDIDEV